MDKLMGSDVGGADVAEGEILGAQQQGGSEDSLQSLGQVLCPGWLLFSICLALAPMATRSAQCDCTSLGVGIRSFCSNEILLSLSDLSDSLTIANEALLGGAVELVSMIGDELRFVFEEAGVPPESVFAAIIGCSLAIVMINVGIITGIGDLSS